MEPFYGIFLHFQLCYKVLQCEAFCLYLDDLSYNKKFSKFKNIYF